MTQVFVFRPEPGFSATVEEGRAMGLDISGQPLFEVESVEWCVPDAGDFDGLLVGSANVFRHGGSELARLSALPVYAVGETTARAARDAGFVVTASGQGGLQNLLDTLDQPRLRLLRLAGEERIELVPRAGQHVTERVVYRAVPRGMAEATVAEMRRGGIVLLHSANAACAFARGCNVHGIDRAVLRIAALAPRIADAVGEGWAGIEIAETPQNGALLALALYMCNND